MTTIVNFIQGNFIANPQEKQVEKPFWVLDCTNLSLNYRPIVQSLVARCKNDKKPLVHIDLGLASFSAYPQAQLQITSENGVLYAKPIGECPYYLVKTQIKDRKKESFLPSLLNKINQDIRDSGNLRSDKAKCSHASYEFGLLIEGLEAWSLLNKDEPYFQKDFEQFISGLMTSVGRIREIVVATWSPLLPPELNFNLERSSTCLTKILACANGEWRCQSTVRRYSGFSNEEEYSLQLMEGGRVRVAKRKQPKGEERSKDQIEMVSSLGFTVEKDEASRQQQRELKERIYPHLKMRQVEPEKGHQECKGNCGCKEKCGGKEGCGCKEESVEDLIVLDEEQEDDDDLDV